MPKVPVFVTYHSGRVTKNKRPEPVTVEPEAVKTVVEMEKARKKRQVSDEEIEKLMDLLRA
jgi:hypothetical protein